MKFTGSLLLLALSLPLSAQTAKVIALSPADSAEAKALYVQRDTINKKIEELQKKITDKYLSVEKPGPGMFGSGATNNGCVALFDGSGIPHPPCTKPTAAEKAAADKEYNSQHHLERIPGWDDFQFSEDFKFIVPVEHKYPSSGPTFMVNPAWVAN